MCSVRAETTHLHVKICNFKPSLLSPVVTVFFRPQTLDLLVQQAYVAKYFVNAW